ncbi:hypothetical protein ACC862_03515 [Rhizobium ruizarguesonis]
MSMAEVVRFARERECGWDRTQLPIATKPHFLKPDKSPFRRVLYPGVDSSTLAEDEIEEWMGYAPMGASVATVKPARNSKRHFRGYRPDPIRNRAIAYNSLLERNWARCLCANRRVVRIEEQPAAIVYELPGAGSHRLDFLATYDDGYRIAYLVKPLAFVEKTRLKDVARTLMAGPLKDIASEPVIITELEASNARAWNAKMVLRHLRSRNELDDQRTRQVASQFAGVFSLMDLLRFFNDRAAARAAVWRLIYEGSLEIAFDDRRLVDCGYLKTTPILLQKLEEEP